MNKRNLKKSLSWLLVVCLIFSTMSISVFAEPDTTTEDVIEAVNSFIKNSALIEKKFGVIPEVTDVITNVYDVDDNLTAYCVDLKFGKETGFALVSATTEMVVLEMSNTSFIQNEKADQKKILNENVKNKKYIFAGPSIYFIKYELNDNETKIYDINTKVEIKDPQQYKINEINTSLSQEKIDNFNESSLMSIAAVPYDVLSYGLPYVNQQLFPTENMRDKGCGPASGAILLWYLATRNSSYSSLKSTYVSAQSLGEGIFNYMMAGFYGTTPTQYSSGIRQYGMVNGFNLSIMTKSNPDGYSNVWYYLKRGISAYNTPVGIYMGREVPGSGPQPGQGAPDYHWITADGWDETSGNYISFQSWGGSYIDNFQAIWNYRDGVAVEYIEVVVP